MDYGMLQAIRHNTIKRVTTTRTLLPIVEELRRVSLALLCSAFSRKFVPYSDQGNSMIKECYCK